LAIQIYGSSKNKDTQALKRAIESLGVKVILSWSIKRAPVTYFHSITRPSMYFKPKQVNGIVFNKIQQYKSFCNRKILTPASLYVSDIPGYYKALKQIKLPAVLKPINLSHSMSIRKMTRHNPTPIFLPGILQEYIETGGVCYRVLVAGDKVAAVSKRIAKDGFRAAYGKGSLGAVESGSDLSDDALRLAIKAASILGKYRIGGVDILPSDPPQVLEVNHRVLEFTAEGMERGLPIVAEYLVSLLSTGKRRKASLYV